MNADNPPVLRVDSGSLIVFETADALSGQITSADDRLDTLDWGRVNPATGPVYVNDAQSGDVLAVTIKNIDIADIGVTVTGPGMGLLGDTMSQASRKVMSIRQDADGKDVVVFSDTLQLPLNKMVGVIGTAPAGGADILNGVPGLHGGNMDCKEVREGATILLPVNVPGALLALGDLHAAMADGEICVSGVEVAGTVTAQVKLLKGKSADTGTDASKSSNCLPLPMIINDTHVMTIAADESLDTAAEVAVRNMAHYLSCKHNFSPEEAAMLISLAGDVRICQLVNPKKTTRVELPRRYLGKEAQLY